MPCRSQATPSPSGPRRQSPARVQPRKQRLRGDVVDGAGAVDQRGDGVRAAAIALRQPHAQAVAGRAHRLQPGGREAQPAASLELAHPRRHLWRQPVAVHLPEPAQPSRQAGLLGLGQGAPERWHLRAKAVDGVAPVEPAGAGQRHLGPYRAQQPRGGGGPAGGQPRHPGGRAAASVGERPQPVPGDREHARAARPAAGREGDIDGGEPAAEAQDRPLRQPGERVAGPRIGDHGRMAAQLGRQLCGHRRRPRSHRQHHLVGVQPAGRAEVDRPAAAAALQRGRLRPQVGQPSGGDVGCGLAERVGKVAAVVASGREAEAVHGRVVARRPQGEVVGMPRMRTHAAGRHVQAVGRVAARVGDAAAEAGARLHHHHRHGGAPRATRSRSAFPPRRRRSPPAPAPAVARGSTELPFRVGREALQGAVGGGVVEAHVAQRR